jgi:hypothetical protein
LFFLKTINATVATTNSGITINIENSGIEAVALGVGVNTVDVAGVGVEFAVVGFDAAGVGEFDVGLSDVDGVGVEVGLADVEIRF